MKTNLFVVGARLATGETARWHVPADSHTDAAQQVRDAAEGEKPTVILTCIPGGKQ